jgi:predicted esterase
VKLQLSSGAQRSIGISQFSDADQSYIKALLGEERTWTIEKSGASVKACLVEVSGGVVSLLAEGRKAVQVKSASLSEEDRRYLAEKVPKTPEELLSGEWDGYSYADGGPRLHRVSVQVTGGKAKALDIAHVGLSAEQIEQIDKKKPSSSALFYPSTFALEHECSVQIAAGKITFETAKAKYKYRSEDTDATWHIKQYSGELQEPGIITGTYTDTDGKEGAFYFVKAGNYDNSRPTDLEKGKTHNMTCAYDSDYHYTLYVPPCYDPSKPAQLLINDSPGGNAAPLSPKMADEKGWIMVGLKEASNESSYKIDAANTCQAILDVRRLLNIDPKRYYFSGLSGGARRSGSRGIAFAYNCAGLICIGAGYAQYYEKGSPRYAQYKVPPAWQPVFFIVGQSDMNNDEVCDRVIPADKQRERKYQLVVHPGGHTWGRAEDHEAAIRWLDEQSKQQAAR